jgi:hypothetical protein
MEEQGYRTPEEAVLAEGDIPAQYVTVVGSRIRGDEAHVWLLTNDWPPFEEYECICVREEGLWHETHGWGSFSIGTPRDVRKRADEIRAASR